MGLKPPSAHVAVGSELRFHQDKGLGLRVKGLGFRVYGGGLKDCIGVICPILR